MSDIAVDGAEKPAKNLFQKLINRETVPTLYAAFSGLSWFSGFLGISALAGVIWNSFDVWLSKISIEIVQALSSIRLTFDAYDIKLGIINSGLIIFGLSGLYSARKKHFKLIDKNSDAILSIFSCAILIAIIIGKSTIIDHQHYADPSGIATAPMEYDLIHHPAKIYIYLIAASLALSLFIIAIYFALRLLKINQNRSYFIITISAFTFTFCVNIFDNYDGIFLYSYDIIESISGLLKELSIACVLFCLALNTKRLRQITMFGLVFMALAAFSAILEKVFPTLVNTHIS